MSRESIHEHRLEASGSDSTSEDPDFRMLHQRVDAAARLALLQEHARNRAPHVELDMDGVVEHGEMPSSSRPRSVQEDRHETNNNGNEVDPDANADEIRTMREMTERWRNDYGRLRQLINQSRETQTLISLIASILPFVTIFLVKFVLDHWLDIGRLMLCFCIFGILDSRVLAMATTVLPTRVEIFASLAVYLGCAATFYWSSSDIEDYKLFKALQFEYAGDEYYGFFTTLYFMIITDLAVKVVTCGAKLLAVSAPSSLISMSRKRRILQVIEYCSQFYRCTLPIPQWTHYFIGINDDMRLYDLVILVFYSILKFRETSILAHSTYLAVYQLLQISHYGTTPTREEIESQGMCSICHEELGTATKLSCSHIFCLSCIDTWLDKEHTCPMCRAVVQKNDNSWKSGATTWLLRMY